MNEPESDAVLDLVLQPHRSLSPAGFWLIMSLVAGFSFVAGLVFWTVGAWPVIGFLGLDVLIVYVAFRASYASGRAYERVRLSPSALTVERVHPSGRRERFALQPQWLRVEVESDSGQQARLRLWSHGRGHTIGAFLPPDECAAVAGVLRDGLDRLRRPPPTPA